MKDSYSLIGKSSINKHNISLDLYLFNSKEYYLVINNNLENDFSKLNKYKIKDNEELIKQITSNFNFEVRPCSILLIFNKALIEMYEVKRKMYFKKVSLKALKYIKSNKKNNLISTPTYDESCFINLKQLLEIMKLLINYLIKNKLITTFKLIELASLYNEANFKYESTKSPESSNIVLETNDILIYGHVFNIKNFINLKLVIGNITLITFKGDLIKEKVTLYKDLNTNYYFILDKDYDDLLIRGKPLCYQINLVRYLSSLNKIDDKNIKVRSIKDLLPFEYLSLLGYDTTSLRFLSSKQRETLLLTAIKNNIYNKHSLSIYLNQCLKEKQDIYLKGKIVARLTSDLEFIKNIDESVIEDIL